MKNIDKSNAAPIWRAHTQLCSAIGAVRTEEADSLLMAIKRTPNHLVGVSLEQRGQVAFAQKKAHKYDTNRRVRLALARYVRRYLDIDIEDSALQIICKVVSERVWGIDTSEVQVLYDADDIVDFYLDTGGDRIGSCMSYEKCSPWIRNVYGNNDNVRLLAVGTPENQRGRAVLWKADCGTLLCDRIYPNDLHNHAHQMIEAKALEMGAIIRSHHGAPYGNEFSQNYTITLRNYDPDNGIPYMDSFYGTDCTFNSTLVLRNSGRCCITLHEYETGNMNYTECEECGDRIDSEDSYSTPDGEHLCEYCYDRLYTICSDCDRAISREDASVTHDGGCVCESCLDDNYFYCENCEELYPVDDCTRTADDTFVCDGCLSQNYTECEKCGDYIENSEIHCVNDDSDYVCSSCLESHYAFCETCEEHRPVADMTGSTCDGCLSEKEEEEENELAVA